MLSKKAGIKIISRRQKTLTYLFQTICCAVLLIQSEYSAAAVVIQYHHVDEDTAESTSLTPTQFAHHMEYLADNGFQVWPLSRIIKTIKEDGAIPEKVVAITFDDGHNSIHINALPIMRKYNFPFTVFINTSQVGGTHFMSWATLRELTSKSGTIANHTVNHPHLVRLLDGESAQQWLSRIQSEIIDAEKIILKQIGYSPGLLAYPFGEFNNHVKEVAAQLGLIGFTQHSGAFGKNVDWQEVPRFAFGGDYAGMTGFADKVNSLPMPMKSIVITDGQGHPLPDTLLPKNLARPKITLLLDSVATAQNIQCFATGQGRLDIHVNNNSITTQPKSNLPVGRSRINCTAPSTQKGRFYWYSHFFMRKMNDGRWYQEP